MAYPGQQADSPTVRQLKRRLQGLETKRGNICARRAYLRNKKVKGCSPSSVHVKLRLFFFMRSIFLRPLGSVRGSSGAEAAAGRAEHRILQPAPSHSSGTCHSSQKPTKEKEFKTCTSYLSLSAPSETREKKRRGAAEEGVGGPGAGENPGQIKILQRGQTLLLKIWVINCCEPIAQYQQNYIKQKYIEHNFHSCC